MNEKEIKSRIKVTDVDQQVEKLWAQYGRLQAQREQFIQARLQVETRMRQIHQQILTFGNGKKPNE